MDELMGYVPLHPLAPALFPVAAGIFGLQMARHLRVVARARPATVTDQGGARVDVRRSTAGDMQVQDLAEILAASLAPTLAASLAPTLAASLAPTLAASLAPTQRSLPVIGG